MKLQAQRVLDRAVIIGVSREATAQASITLADASVTALIDIGVSAGLSGEELVDAKHGSLSHVLVVLRGGTPVGGNVGGDHVSQIMQLAKRTGMINAWDGDRSGVNQSHTSGGSVLSKVLVRLSVQALSSVQVDVGRVPCHGSPRQHGEQISLVQAMVDVLHLVGIVVAKLTRHITVKLVVGHGVIGGVGHVNCVGSE